MGELKLNINKFFSDTIPQLLLLFSIVIDSINGATQEFMGVHLPIGIAFRGGILLLLFSKGIYLRNNKFNLLFRIIICLYIFAMVIWATSSYYFSLPEEFSVLFRFVYFFVVLFYFINYRNIFNKQKLVHYVVLAAVIISSLNIFCFLTDTGIKSYADEFGFGSKAFYADGNSIGLYLVLSLCLSIWYAYYKRNVWAFLMVIVISIGTILVGTRASMIGTLAAWTVLPLSFTFFKDKLIRMAGWKKIAIQLTITAIIVFIAIPLFTTIINFDTFNEQRFTSESIVSPREMLIQDGMKVINEYQGTELVIGNGNTGGLVALGQIRMSDSGLKSIEADFYDQILYYGWGLGILMILINVVLWWQCTKHVFIKLNTLTLTIAIIGSVWLLASHLAGHGFFNTMLAPLFGAILAIVSNNGHDFNKDKR